MSHETITEEPPAALITSDDHYATIPLAVISADISDRAFRVYAALRTYVRPGHATFPKMATLRETFGMSESYIKRGIKELQEVGLIVVTKRHYSGGFVRVNSYHFPRWDPSRQVKPDPSETYRSDPGQVRSDPPGQSEAVTSPDRSDLTPPIEEEKYEEEKLEKREGPQAGSPPAKKPRRGTRLPEGWLPDPHVREAMMAECPAVDFRSEHAKFVDHWLAQPGQKGVKSDWNATWRNWIRRAAEWGPTATRARSSRQQETDDLFTAAMQRAEAGVPNPFELHHQKGIHA